MSPFTPYKFGKYAIVGKIASGGMAELLKAKVSGEHGFEKVLAIKKIHPHFDSEAEMLSAFIDEARLAARLQHHNIVQVVDFGSVGGRYFMAMEYLEGFDLRTLLNRAATGEQLDPAHALFIIAKVCDGLQYAHSLQDDQGNPLRIIHRDISPANIFLTSGGEVKIIDFGIARAASHNRATMVGTLKGKIPYMAPEQALGSQIDHRADIYAVGAVLYELLAGRPLFIGAGIESLEMVRRGQFEPPERAIPGQGEDLYRIFHRSLATDPGQRYGSCLEMIEDIESYLTDHHLRPSNRSLQEYLKRLPPEKEKVPVKEPAPLEATQVCDVFNTNEDMPPSAPPSKPPWWERPSNFLVDWVSNNLPRLAVAGAVGLLVLLAYLQLSTRYTAFNLWVPRNSTLYSIDYKGDGALLPAGTEVKDIKVDEAENRISFRTDDDREITIIFNPKWHPGKNVADFADELLTSKSFKSLTRHMSSKEVAAVKSGMLVEGMSKQAVLVAYGPPPEQGTASVEANQWTYWLGRFDQRKICFDEEERLLASCPSSIMESQDKNVLEKLGGKIRGFLNEEK